MLSGVGIRWVHLLLARGVGRVSIGGGPVNVVTHPEEGETMRVLTDILPGGQVGLLTIQRSLDWSDPEVA